MSLVSKTYDGEKAMGPAPKRRETGKAAIRDRARSMYLLRLRGLDAGYVGAMFRVTARHVNREIALLPKTEKDLIRKEYRRGGEGMAGLSAAG